MLIAAGEDVYSVSRAMGHANVSTTLNVYAGEIDQARHAAQQRSSMSGRYGNLVETATRKSAARAGSADGFSEPDPRLTAAPGKACAHFGSQRSPVRIWPPRLSAGGVE